MLENQSIIIAVCSMAAALGFLTTGWILSALKKHHLEITSAEREVLFREKEQSEQSLTAKLEELRTENNALVQENIKLISDLENQKKYFEKQRADDEQIKKSFKEISNEIILAQNKTFGDEQKNIFNLLLKPFQEQMADFRQKVEAAHQDSIKNKSSFDEQIKNLLRLNQNLSKDAEDLSTALKGNKKIQGNWGEFQLERVLEISGLQKGINYDTQETLKNDENRQLRPDAIVHLPDKRNVIVDSKVSLNDYIAYINTEDETERAEHLKKHIQALKNHIDELSDKEYQKLLKENALDYVMIFVPVESAYVEAVRADNTLYDYAYKKNIALTTPSSLLPVLRTVENLWRIESQNKYVGKIAEAGGALYDKIVNFTEDMQRIDKALETARKNYDSAMNKLSTGKGNALSLATRLKDYGAKASKTLNLEHEDSDAPLLEDLNDEAANS